MKRPMCVVGLALALATLGAFLFSSKQALLVSVALALTGVLACVWRRNRPDARKLRAFCAVCMAGAAAFALSAWREERQRVPFLSADGETVVVEGFVSEARVRGRAVDYEIAARFPQRPDLPDAPTTLRAWGEQQIFPGEAVRCEARLRVQTPPGLRMASSGFLQGEIQGEAVVLEGGYPLQRGATALRESLRRNVYALLPSETADAISAMVLGAKDSVPPETYTALSRAGTVHLLTVSGMHLSILTAMVLGVLERLKISVRLRSLTAILAALVFSVMVGFSASIARAFTMTALALAGDVFGNRRSDSLSSLGLAVTLICLVRPEWVLGRGFWLSAGSTLGILLFAAPLTARLTACLSGGGPLRKRFVRFAAGAVAVSLSAYAVTLPFMVLFYGFLSIVSPLANLLVAPFVPGAIAGGALCAAVGGASWPMRAVAVAADFCVAAVLRISEIMAGIPFAGIALDEFWRLLWLGYALAVVAVLVRFRTREGLVRYGALLLALAFGAGSLSFSVSERNSVQLVSIADCDAAILLRGGEAVILGTPAYYEVGRLMRYLDFRDVRAVRAVVASDCGEQVGSGLSQLAARYPVDCVVGPSDAYILNQISLALPDVPVYSGGYAQLSVLGGVQVQTTAPEGNMIVRLGSKTVMKTTAEYGIMTQTGEHAVTLFPDGAVVLQGAPAPEPTPLGRLLHGETRFLFF